MSSTNLELLGWFLLAVGLPVGVLSLVIFRQMGNWLTLALLCFGWLGGLYSLFAGAWTFYSYWSALLILVFMIWGVAAAMRRLRQGSWAHPGWVVSIISGVLLGLSGWFLYYNVLAIKNMRPPERTVDLAFPFSGGTYAISQGGSGPPLQGAHFATPSQVYAVDITMINAAGVSRRTLEATAPESFVIWGKEVLSPCDGRVVWSRDGIVDRIGRDPVTPAGNVLAIECQGVIVYLAHFRQGTVQVNEGDRVSAGQFLGEVGASGNTGGPHLHIHAEEPPFAGEFSKNNGVAMMFDGRYLWKPRVYSDQVAKAPSLSPSLVL